MHSVLESLEHIIYLLLLHFCFPSLVLSQSVTNASFQSAIQNSIWKSSNFFSTDSKDDVKFHLCNSTSISPTNSIGTSYICFIPGNDILLALILDFENEFPAVPQGMNQNNLVVALADGLGGIAQTLAKSNDSFLPAVYEPHAHLPSLNFASGDAGVYLESFPCTGMAPIRTPEYIDPIHPMRYSDVALALQGLTDVLTNYRNSSNNAGYGIMVDVGGGMGTEFGMWNYLGFFSMQSRSAPYTPFSELLQQVWTCTGLAGKGGNYSSAVGTGPVEVGLVEAS